MILKNNADLLAARLGAILVMVIVPMMIWAQEIGPPNPDPKPNPNPTQRWISPRNHQSEEQQLSAEWDCYDWACDQTDWDPYEAYFDLVDAGYAVALTREEMEEGLICLAWDGAVTGSVAGEILGDSETGAEIGTAIAIASRVIRSDYLNQHADPQARRTISGFERKLRTWDRKFAACLRPKGYRVSSP